MKKIAFLIVLYCFQFNAIAAEMTIKPMVAPTIDADASDWSTNWCDFGLQNTASTTNDMTGKFQLGYDNNCLYIIAEIYDATPNNDEDAIANSYERDCLEVFFAMDMDTAGIGTKYHDGVWQIRKQRSPEEGGIDGNNGQVGGGDNWNVTPLTSSSKFKAMSSGASSPYYVELALPWDSLGYNLRTKWGGKEFWFDIAIADNTTGTAGGRTDQKYWNNNSDEQWHNTSAFGKVVFPGPTKKSGLFTLDTKSKYKTSRCGEELVVSEIISNLVTIFPNPLTKTITIEELDGKFETLIVTDLYGRQVKLMNIQNQSIIVFSRDGLSSGLYFIRLLGKKNNSGNYKVVIN